MSRLFQIDAISGSSRAGRLLLSGAEVSTPVFMPVATRGAFKGISTVNSVVERFYDLILCNSWHLWLRPGVDVIEECGGLHSFIGWRKNILTDSGGFQVFSLARQVKYSDSGVRFISPYDGQYAQLTPELAIKNQIRMGVDIGMVLDVCSALPTDRESVEYDMELTHKWAMTAVSTIEASHPSRTTFFGIIQGGIFEDLRIKSASVIHGLGFEGLAVGGLAVGERKSSTYRVLKLLGDFLPADKPRYVMGLGLPLDLLVAVKFGFDMFDCVLPTRAARFGRAYVNSDELWINLKSSDFIHDTNGIDPACECNTCRNFSRAYLSHLFRVDEMLGGILVTEHNLSFYRNFMEKLRNSILLDNSRVYLDEQIRTWLTNPKFVSIIGEPEVEEVWKTLF